MAKLAELTGTGAVTGVGVVVVVDGGETGGAIGVGVGWVMIRGCDDCGVADGLGRGGNVIDGAVSDRGAAAAAGVDSVCSGVLMP